MSKVGEKNSLNSLDPLVTIVMAVFNGANTIQQAIDSIDNQDYKEKELIVIDGGSLDGTVDIIKMNENKINYWISEPDSGIYQAWNKALDRAKGEWVCFIGVDDYWTTNNSLKDLVNLAKSSDNADIVSGKNAVIDDNHNVIRNVGTLGNWQKLLKTSCIAHVGALHHRRIFENIGRFNESFKIAGDYDLLLRAGKDTRFAFLDQVVVNARNGGVCRKDFFQALFESWKIQFNHPEISYIKASTNFAKGLIIALVRRVIGSV